MINEREPYQVDWQTVLQAALEYGKALEINAQPSRLDLPDDLVYEARKMGIKLIINTDAHNLSSLDYMHFGIDVARRGWCAEEDVLNTLPLPEFLRQLKK